MTQRAINQNKFPYFVTFNVQARNQAFADFVLATRLHQTIRTACSLKHFTLYAFCILPDHVHILVKKDPSRKLSISRGLVTAKWNPAFIVFKSSGGKSPRSDISSLPEHVFSKARELTSSPRRAQKEHTLSDLLQSIKGTFSWGKPYHGRLWQPRSYCRIITSERYLRNVLAYIQNNYQKHGLPRNPYGFPPYVFINEKAVNSVFGLDA